MFSLLEKLLAAVAAFFVFINREKDRQSGRITAENEGFNEVLKRENEADKIRGTDLDNQLLLPASQRPRS